MEQNSSKRFSLVVCDEAHRLKKKSAIQHKAVENLLEFADAALFLTHGFHIEKVQPVDMFCWTSDVETVCCLRR